MPILGTYSWYLFLVQHRCALLAACFLFSLELSSLGAEFSQSLAVAVIDSQIGVTPAVVIAPFERRARDGVRSRSGERQIQCLAHYGSLHGDVIWFAARIA